MKKHSKEKRPLASVDSIPESKQDEPLTEEQVAEIKKVFRQCVRILIVSVCLFVFSFVCILIDKLDLLNASHAANTPEAIGFFGLGCLIVTLILLLIARKKLKILTQKYSKGN